ncbi:hypothetical protein O2K51_00770 [Apibacter raozihei]|uniref:hypothetical protein n=1 Tax=Apibacter raozihei TaxID=2500547 RepID=UPI000FE313FD|nr:hypothetical protein [Apibacter raozihei]
MINYGIDEQSAFCELMSNYSGEFSGSEGTIMNVANDLSYGNDSYEFSLHEKGLPKKYLQLLTSEYDDYLLYNIENDSVILILGANDIKLQHGEFDKEWDSFNDFLEDFFEIE